jgi:hypothetical protein
MIPLPSHRGLGFTNTLKRKPFLKTKDCIKRQVKLRFDITSTKGICEKTLFMKK